MRRQERRICCPKRAILGLDRENALAGPARDSAGSNASESSAVDTKRGLSIAEDTGSAAATGGQLAAGVEALERVGSGDDAGGERLGAERALGVAKGAVASDLVAAGDARGGGSSGVELRNTLVARRRSASSESVAARAHVAAIVCARHHHIFICSALLEAHLVHVLLPRGDAAGDGGTGSAGGEGPGSTGKVAHGVGTARAVASGVLGLGDVLSLNTHADTIARGEQARDTRLVDRVVVATILGAVVL